MHQNVKITKYTKEYILCVCGGTYMVQTVQYKQLLSERCNDHLKSIVDRRNTNKLRCAVMLSLF